jgi:type I restriction-modification system DNA methylase subunit
MAKTAKTEQEEPLEKKLWKAADKLRKNMDAAEYKHVALGLIFLKYISDAFEEQYQKLVAQKSEGADPEDKNEYLADKIFFVPVMLVGLTYKAEQHSRPLAKTLTMQWMLLKKIILLCVVFCQKYLHKKN